jgi:hypothetical protein
MCGGGCNRRAPRKAAVFRRAVDRWSCALFSTVLGPCTPASPGVAVSPISSCAHRPPKVRALRVGATGFVTGMSVGRALIEEQTSLLSSVLSSMNGLLGSPYAELLWCQVSGRWWRCVHALGGEEATGG